MYQELKDQAKIIRRHIVEMVHAAKSGHPGGSLSATEILTALYFKEMKQDPANPDWPERDRFILSKGHASPVIYAVLAEKGYFPVEWLPTFRKIDSNLQGHPARHKTPGVEVSTGSLGQGLSMAVGQALGGKLSGADYRVWALCGDGELQEGQIWEAAMASAHYGLDNLAVFIDSNNLQIDGKVTEVMGVQPIAKKFEAFGWHAVEIDGHSFEEIFAAIEEAKATKGKPTVIVARTVKGKGVSFMEDQANWHGVAPNDEQLAAALAELQ